MPAFFLPSLSSFAYFPLSFSFSFSPSPSLAHILKSISCACLYSKYDTKKSRTVEEFLLCGLAWRSCNERTQQQKGLWIMKHMRPSPPRTQRGETCAKWKGSAQLLWRHWDMQKVKLGTGISQNQKWERRLKGETAAPLLAFAMLLTGTGGGTCNCTWKRMQKKREEISLFLHLPEDLTLSHSSDSGGGEISTAAVQTQGDSPPTLTC